MDKQKRESRMDNWLRERYGADELTSALAIIGLIFCAIGIGQNLQWLIWLAIALFLVSLARMSSKKKELRALENQMFLNKVVNPVKGAFKGKGGSGPGASRGAKPSMPSFKDLKDYKYMKCPECNNLTRVPRGKGKIRVTCPKCHHKFITKS